MYRIQLRAARVPAFVLGAALAVAACGGDSVRDSITLPETAPSELVAEFEGVADTGEIETPTTTAELEAATTTTEAPTAETTTPEPEEAPDGTISPDITIPEAVSESGRSPAYGGGNGGIPLAEALNVTMPTVGGEPIDVSQYLGRDVVLWFWAPWCSWCNAEAPRVNEMSREYEGRVEIVGVSGLSDEEGLNTFVGRHGLEHITHLDDADGSFWVNLDVTYQPWWMFINDNGEVVLNWQGRLSNEEIREVMDILVVS